MTSENYKLNQQLRPGDRIDILCKLRISATTFYRMLDKEVEDMSSREKDAYNMMIKILARRKAEKEELEAKRDELIKD